MAFDLVQYFEEQIETQKPELLSDLSRDEKRQHIREINALTLGALIQQSKTNGTKVYQEIFTEIIKKRLNVTILIRK